MKGQVSIEFLLIMGFAFLLIIPVLIIFLTEAQNINEDVTSAQINKLAEELESAVNNVYYLGEPTTKTIEIYVPKFLESATFSGNLILFNVSTGSSDYSVAKFTSGNVSGTLNTNYGMHSIKISAQENTVLIEG